MGALAGAEAASPADRSAAIASKASLLCWRLLLPRDFTLKIVRHELHCQGYQPKYG